MNEVVGRARAANRERQQRKKPPSAPTNRQVRSNRTQAVRLATSCSQRATAAGATVPAAIDRDRADTSVRGGSLGYWASQPKRSDQANARNTVFAETHGGPWRAEFLLVESGVDWT
ncbi:hypothetical protein GCM10027360_25640 [Amycolatopsis echigonensis]